ncbi:acetyl-CoA carboxylase biotin carboxyl carrier protein subunit [Mangrovimonas yunxiaonensis]|nr:acetyl-CoA carboxylase biotin carboxyl carrier protein subunit [Mangrovimonas yunxiaonensis]GGH43857.1 hypothetical protein GCM10011364_16310 [Mangrovimonas yunxiaonensis]
MHMYHVTVNGVDSFEISQDDISNLDAIATTKNTYHVLQQHTSYKAQVLSKDLNNKTYQVAINNTVYTINVEDTLDRLIKEMGFELGVTKHINNIKAPMPGLILDINVSVGQEVKEDDTLLILEAMKMENVLTSPRDGVIKSISVSKGDAVDKNQLLLEFE